MFKNIYKNDAMKRADHEAVRKRAGWYSIRTSWSR